MALDGNDLHDMYVSKVKKIVKNSFDFIFSCILFIVYITIFIVIETFPFAADAGIYHIGSW